jgi:DNA-directed DNA polymerase III PolC
MNLLDNFEEYKLPLLENGVRLPDFEIPSKIAEELGLRGNISDYDFLKALSEAGLKQKIGLNHPNIKEYKTRLKTELDSFNELGFCGYTLITWDIVRFCRESNIATGYGRGSCAGSLVLYLIDVVSHVDPIINKLYFERFLSKTRAKFKEVNGAKYYDGSLLFDVDLDVEDTRRDKVFTYISEKYPGRTAKICNMNTLTSKILVKEVVKAYLEFNEESATEISEMIPKLFGKVHDLDKSIEESKEFANFVNYNPDVLKICKSLYELPSHLSVHASAMLISYRPIDEFIPLQLVNNKETEKMDKITAYSMDDALNLAVKIDILGLNSASLISDVCNMINIRPNDIDIHDPMIYENLRNLQHAEGLFQVSSPTNFNVLKKVKPRNLEDLAAIVALARPGALQFVEQFADYVQTGKFQSIHPFLDDVFQETGSLCLYQEQLMKATNKIGFSLEEAEILRRIVGKKKLHEVKEWQEKIHTKIKENKLDPVLGDIIWKILDDSASYSFNKSHSVAYASMCAATTYLKFKYPREFYLNLLKLSREKSNQIECIQKIQAELMFFDIKLLGPDLLKSNLDFTLEGDDIRFGLSSIKNIADKSFEKLMQFQKSCKNKFQIFLAAEEAKLRLSIVCNLCQAGCLDTFLGKYSRSRLVLEVQTFGKLTPREKKRIFQIAGDFDYDLFKIIKYLSTSQNGEKSFMSESRLETLRRDYSPFKEIYKKNSENEGLCNYFFEKKLLGYSYSQHLEKLLRVHYPELMDINEVKSEIKDLPVCFCGEVEEVKYFTARNKKKTKCCKLLLRDSTGSITVMMFNDCIAFNEENNGGQKYENGQILVVKGTTKQDCVFANQAVNQAIKIVTKLSEVEEKEPKKEKILV